MQKILRKRLLRDFRANLFRYLSLGLMIVLCMYLIVSLTAAAETVIQGVEQLEKETEMEDGEFTVFTPLTDDQEQKLKETGVTLENMFYLDFDTKDQGTLRLFSNREKLNLLTLDTGRLAKDEGEAVLEKRYCMENGLKVGDFIRIGSQKLKITGMGSVPDYDAPYKELSDSSVDSKNFGLVFVSQEQYEGLKEGENSIRSESSTYAYKRSGKVTNEKIKEVLKGFTFPLDDRGNLIQFLPAEDNPRIGASADDQIINKAAGLTAGVIILILFSYVISVFIIHSIEQESSVIGTLYAMGVKKKELIIHYLMLPVIVTSIGGVTGTVLGFSRFGLDVQIQDCYKYFSIPKLAPVYSGYLIVYGVLMPPVLAVLVNYLIMNKKLSSPVLSLINKAQKQKHVKNLNLGNTGFVGCFRIRQMLREFRSTGTVIFGMFISLLILMLGVDCYVMCVHISSQNKEDTKFEYMYTYKYPDEEVPEGGAGAYAAAFTKENLGYQLDVTLLGIDRENPYFDVDTKKGESRVILSSAAAQKFGLKEGDQLILTDKEKDRDYAFTVEGITQYSPSLYVFMDIGSMRELFGKADNYFNVVFSDKSLDIPSGQLYAVTSKGDIEKSSDIFSSMMMPMISMLSAVSVLVFAVVMYLMMKVMIDRSSFGISLLKVFGYRQKEVRRLYLNGNFYIVAVGAAICLPLSKKTMDVMYPSLVANVGCAMDLSFTWQMYVGIYVGIMVLYLLINAVLAGKLKKILPAEVLKNRE